MSVSMPYPPKPVLVDRNMVIDRCLSVIKLPASAQQLALLAQLTSAIVLENVSVAYINDRIAEQQSNRKIVAALSLVPQPAQRTPEWFCARHQAITASDLSAAIGASRYSSQRDFYLKKNEAVTSFKTASTPAMAWGTQLEPVAAKLYAEMLGVELVDFGLLKHHDPKWAFISASPDGITRDHGVVVEFKCPFSRKPKIGDVPAAYMTQIQSQLSVVSLKECDFVEFVFTPYANAAECIADTTTDKKGAIQDLGSGRYEYMYFPCNDAKVIDEWSSKKKTLWWKYESVNIVRVYRDDEYITGVYEKAAAVWSNVLRYRADPVAFNNEVILNKTCLHSEKTTLCTIDTDSDDEDV